ncbi:MAG TPA: FCD domain-containing protein [Acidimicrobiales bacterium]
MAAKRTPKAPPSEGAETAEDAGRSGTRSSARPPVLSLASERVANVTMASSVADAIVHDIVARGWPEGEVLGSEPELLERYGVSRAVFREAVRLVEHKEVASMRRGPGGGLVVTAPTVESVIDAVAVYLFYVDADVEEVFEARLVLEEVVTELAPGRLGEEDVLALRELLAREQRGEVRDYRELHALLARVTGNPALEFFVDVLNRVSQLFMDDPSLLERSTISASSHAHTAIGQAVLAGDEGLAKHRMRKHLQAEAEYLRRVARTRIGLPRPTSRHKRGQQVASAILQDIADAGWPVGTLLGSEKAVIERYGVSRAVLREAVRVLEHHQVARMRRGPGGGLLVAEPGVAATTEAVALHLHRMAITPAQLLEVRSAVEIAILDRAVERLTDDDVARLEQALAAERAATPEELRDLAHGVHRALAGMSGNRVLELLALVLLRLTRLHQGPRPRREVDAERAKDLAEVHGRIVEAIAERDLEVARLRMRSHLRALTEFVS